jgi:hypothetical protein
MNIKREIIALGIRLLADKTSLVQKPDSFTLLLNSMFGGETYDQQLARKIETDLDKAVDVTKRKITEHKFKKIIKNF